MLPWVAVCLLTLWYLSWTALLLWGVSLLRVVQGPCEAYSAMAHACVTFLQIVAN